MSQSGKYSSGVIPPGTYIEQIDGDVGFVSGAVVSFNATPSAGSTIQFSGSGTTMLFEVTDADANTIMGNNAGNALISGSDNTSFGAGNLVSITSGNENSAFGDSVLIALEDGSGNTALGQLALFELIDGNDNTVIGSSSGGSYTGSESNNIILGASINGTTGESNTLRIGASTGTGQGQLDQSFIHGIRGIVQATADQVLINDSAGQIISIAAGTTGQVLTSQGAGANPIWDTPAASSITITGDSGGPLVGNSFTFTGGTTGLLFAGAVSTETLTGTLVVSNGGTGRTTLTNHGVLVGAGTTAITQLAVGTTGQVLTGVTGSDPIWAAPAASSISITGDSGGALVGNAFTFTGGTTGLTFSGAVATETLGGTLVVSNGGTGNTTFTAYSVICAGTTATGQFQNVSGVGTSGQVLTSNGAGMLPTWQSGGGGGISQIDGDSGSATGSTITFTATPTAGSTISFDASGASVVFNVSDASDNTLFGLSAGNGSISGSANTGFGTVSLTGLTSGSFNTAVGMASAGSIQDGTANTAIGYQALSQLVSGNGNVIIGQGSGTSYTTNESNNIIIGTAILGTAAESAVTRIGEGQSECYISGIATVSVSNKEYVTIDTTTGQLGSDSGPSGGLAWSVITGDQTASVNNGYICNKAGTLALALPATSAVGDIIEVTGINTALGWQITQASGQQIFAGTTSTTLGATGTFTSSATRDSLRIVCITANTTWQVLSSVGNPTTA